MYNPVSTLSNFYNTFRQLVTARPVPSDDLGTLGSENITHHLKSYQLLGDTTFEDYCELHAVFAGWRASQTNIIFSTVAWVLLFNRVKQLSFTLMPVKTYNVRFYMLNLNNVYFLKTLLLKLAAPTSTLSSQINSLFTIRFSPTNLAKYLTNPVSQFLEILFLRKSKIFNKGRYSRNRQFYRTGVYWCLYVNIIAMVGLYFWFYRFVMNFGYLWWMLYLSVVVFAFAKLFQYDLLLPHKLVKSLKNDVVFFGTLVSALCSKILRFSINTINQPAGVRSRLNDAISFISNALINLVTTRYVLGVCSLASTSLMIRRFTSINYYIYSITLDHSRVFLDAKKNESAVSFIKTLLH